MRKKILEGPNFQSAKFSQLFYIAHNQGTGVYAFFVQSASFGR
jgi:hypothetical protein